MGVFMVYVVKVVKVFSLYCLKNYIAERALIAIFIIKIRVTENTEEHNGHSGLCQKRQNH